jgi:Cdc6-like AAA superfamily ATPase
VDFLSMGITVAGLIYLGIDYLNRDMTLEDYMRHTITTGQTGTGKSVKARNLILKLIKYGGCLFIDAHGSDSRELLDEIPDSDKDRVIYINPSDLDMPIGINMYSDIKSELQNELSVNQLLSIFENLWAGFIGPSTEDLIRMSGLSVVEQEISTLLETYLMLSNEGYRTNIEVQNEVAKDFWTNIFPDFKPQVLNPPLNKFRALVAPVVHRLTLCQSKPKLDLLQAMNEGKIIICNFPQSLGDKTSQLLSSIMVSKMQLLGFTRDKKSTPFFLVLDEYQNYVTRSFVKILSEARKFNLGIHLFNQYNSQIPDYILAAIAGNCGSRYSFRVGELDAPYLSKFLKPFTEDDLVNLPNFTYIAKRLINGKKETKAHMYAAPPPPKKYNNAEYIIDRSRKLYGIPRYIIEDDILERMNPKKAENTNEGVF